MRLFNRLHGTRHAILRLGNVYGPRQDPSGEAGVVSIFAGRVVRNERPTVFGDGSRRATTSMSATSWRRSWPPPTRASPGLWNVGTGREVSVIDLIDELAGDQRRHDRARVRARPAGRAAGLVPRPGRRVSARSASPRPCRCGTVCGPSTSGCLRASPFAAPCRGARAVIPLLAVALAIALLRGHGGRRRPQRRDRGDRRRGGVRARRGRRLAHGRVPLPHPAALTAAAASVATRCSRWRRRTGRCRRSRRGRTRSARRPTRSPCWRAPRSPPRARSRSGRCWRDRRPGRERSASGRSSDARSRPSRSASRAACRAPSATPTASPCWAPSPPSPASRSPPAPAPPGSRSRRWGPSRRSRLRPGPPPPPLPQPPPALRGSQPGDRGRASELNARLDGLWNEHRALKARIASATPKRSSSGPASKSGWSARPNRLRTAPGGGYTFSRSGR